ncbi:class I SAM-dependent methyltransferase [Fischerella sp. PCC 9605]|uniref:class I SAM-dependent methyltransferase n=1 Tax=Fischerella sp. PCC 9605 TaxID=1173024 RepID=UPI00047C22CC|nr:methyltransferase domain-containing protein [Fischerella sp. PCC 9605]
MTQQLELNDYKQQIADLYSRRSHNYDESDWHLQIAHRLVEYTQIISGQQVLDIATGTGMVAIEAAQIVGSEGRVVGVDISAGMLEQATRKIEALGLSNIELHLADAETLNFPANSFDRILCSSALIWMADIPATLRLWYQFLKPDGLIGFHGFADTAFIAGVVMKEVCKKYGVSLTYNDITGTADKCYNLLASAGFEEIEVKVEQYGSYISLEQAKQMWMGGSNNPTPGQFPNPLSQLSSLALEQAKARFDAELEALVTDQGIWNDITVFFTFGRKPANKG